MFFSLFIFHNTLFLDFTLIINVWISAFPLSKELKSAFFVIPVFLAASTELGHKFTASDI